MEQMYSGYSNTFIQYGEIKSYTKIKSYTLPDQALNQLEIRLYFQLETVSYSYIANVDSGEMELARSPTIYPTADLRLILKLDELLERALDVIEQKLTDALNIRDDFMREWVDSVLKAATEVVGSMPAEHNIALIASPARLNYEYLYDPRLEEEAAAEEDDQNNYMVPAAEAWINQALVKRTLTLTEYSSDDDRGFGTCAVCLEDFTGGEVLSMPCEHYFHEDCIGEWLRTSHYCPVCRFQVPTMMMS